MNRAGIENNPPFFNRTKPNGFMETKINHNMFL